MGCARSGVEGIAVPSGSAHHEQDDELAHAPFGAADEEWFSRGEARLGFHQQLFAMVQLQVQLVAVPRRAFRADPDKYRSAIAAARAAGNPGRQSGLSRR